MPKSKLNLGRKEGGKTERTAIGRGKSERVFSHFPAHGNREFILRSEREQFRASDFGIDCDIIEERLAFVP